MWLAVLFAGWLITSLVIGPWIGRFIGVHTKMPDEPVAASRLAGEAEAAEPIPMMHRA